MLSYTSQEVQFPNHINDQSFLVYFVVYQEDCVIWIPVAGRFFLKFSTENANALLNASILSNMVWLYGQCNGPSCMLNFPFGQLGSLTFYFGEDNAGSEDDAGFHKR